MLGDVSEHQDGAGGSLGEQTECAGSSVGVWEDDDVGGLCVRVTSVGDENGASLAVAGGL